MIAVAAIVQADPALVDQLGRLVTTQIVVAAALTIVALAALGVAIGALLAVRKLSGTVERALAQITPRIDPLLATANRIADDAEDVASSVKVRVGDVLDTIDDLNLRLKSGAHVVETRLRHFGAVVEVVQAETENLLLDAASTARGVHSAAQVLRTGSQPSTTPEEIDVDEDVFTD